MKTGRSRTKKNKAVRRLLSLAVPLSFCGPVSVQAGAQTQDGGGESAAEAEVRKVQDMINALPGPAEVKGLDTDGQRDVYDRLQAAYDAYESLAVEQQAQLYGAAVLEQLSGWFNSQAALLDEEADAGSFGEFYWELEGSTLIISGSGEMKDLALGENPPWQGKAFTEVEFQGKVESIGKSAFANCRSLEKIVIPDSVKSIGEEAFRSCSSLSQITLPDGLESIGTGAFRFCRSLEKIVLPSGVKTINSKDRREK